jgi:hypothetical protein
MRVEKALCKYMYNRSMKPVEVRISGRDLEGAIYTTVDVSFYKFFEKRWCISELTEDCREAICHTMPKYVNVEEIGKNRLGAVYQIVLDDLDEWFERAKSYLVYGLTSYNKLISSEFREKDSLEKIREKFSGRTAICKAIICPYPEVMVVEIFGEGIGLTAISTAWVRISDIFKSRWGTGLTGYHLEAIRYTMPKYINVEEKVDEDRRPSYEIVLDDLDEWFAKAKGFLAYAIPKQEQIIRQNKEDQVRKQEKEGLDEDGYRRRRGSGFAKAASMNTGL